MISRYNYPIYIARRAYIQLISTILYLCINLFLLYPTSATSQPLSQLLNQTFKNNLTLKTLDLEYRAALEKVPQVSQLPDPELGLGVFPLPVETRLGAQQFRLGATQMFPWFGTLEKQGLLEQTKASAQFEGIAAKALELSFSLKKAYLQLYELRQSREIIEGNLVILESLMRLALAKVESGQATTADVLQVQLKMQALQQELEILKAKEGTPTATINQLRNADLNTPILIDEILTFTNLLYDKDTLTANIQADHPMLRMFKRQQEISQQAKDLNQLSGKPSFGVGLDYIAVNKRTDAVPANNGRDILQLRASVKIPLYREKFEAKEREENLKILALDHHQEDLLSSFLAAIEQAYVIHETARLQLSLYEKQMELTQSTIDILEAKYSAQGQNIEELLRLEQDLINYKLKMLKAVVQSHLAKISIERFLKL